MADLQYWAVDQSPSRFGVILKSPAHTWRPRAFVKVLQNIFYIYFGLIFEK
jgi:hypothetical protein